MPQRGGLSSWGLEGRCDCKTEPTEKGTGRELVRRKEIPPSGGGDCGYHGPGRFYVREERRRNASPPGRFGGDTQARWEERSAATLSALSTARQYTSP